MYTVIGEDASKTTIKLLVGVHVCVPFVRRYQPEWKLKNALNHKVNWSHNYVCIKSCWIYLMFIILEYNFNYWNSYDCIINVDIHKYVHERHRNAASSWVK